MAQAPRDQNYIPTLLAASDADGITPVPIAVDPFNHTMVTETNVVASAQKAIAPRDQNRIPTILGVSSTDGTTPVVIYADPVTKALYLKIV